MRLKAIEIDSKSSDERTLLTASAPASASTISSGIRRQHRVHHVVLAYPRASFKIELQSLAEELRGRSAVDPHAKISFRPPIRDSAQRASAIELRDAMGSLCSAIVLTIPLACRRNAKGSFDPLGCKPQRKHARDTDRLCRRSKAPRLQRSAARYLPSTPACTDRKSRSQSQTLALRPRHHRVLHAGVKSADNPCSSVNSFTSSVVRSVFARQRRLVHNSRANRHPALIDRLRQPTAQPLHAQRLCRSSCLDLFGR